MRGLIEQIGNQEPNGKRCSYLGFAIEFDKGEIV